MNVPTSAQEWANDVQTRVLSEIICHLKREVPRGQWMMVLDKDPEHNVYTVEATQDVLDYTAADVSRIDFKALENRRMIIKLTVAVCAEVVFRDRS